MAQKTKSRGGALLLVILLAGAAVVTFGRGSLDQFTRQDNWVDLDIWWRAKNGLGIIVDWTVDGKTTRDSGVSGRFHRRVYDWWGQAEIVGHVSLNWSGDVRLNCNVRASDGRQDPRSAVGREIGCRLGA